MPSSKPGGKRGPEHDEEPKVDEDEAFDLFGLRSGPKVLDVLIGEKLGFLRGGFFNGLSWASLAVEWFWVVFSWVGFW